MKSKKFIYLVCTLLTISCNVQDKREIVESASAFDLSQAKAAIKQSTLTLKKAFEKDDTATIVNAYTKNALLLPAGHEALEDDSMRYYLIQLLNSNVKSIDIKSEGVWGDSSLLAEEGTYALEGKNNTHLDKGKYIVLWKRESGNWKIYRQMWTSNLQKNKVVPDTMNQKHMNK